MLAETAQVNYIGADGQLQTVETVERTNHKVYKGDAFIKREGSDEWANAGWARLSMRRDGPNPLFEGALRVERDHFHIQTSTNYRKTKHPSDPAADEFPEEYMVVWRDSDIMTQLPGLDELKRDLGGHSCMSDSMDFNMNPDHPVYEGIVTPSQLELAQGISPWWSMNAMSIFRRQDSTLGGNGNVDSLGSTIGSTNGCPTTRKVALVGIATDCTYTAAFESNSDVTENIINLVNTASALFENTFNISLGIQNLTITDANCPETASDTVPWNLDCDDADITQRLNLFSEWRGRFTDTNAYWTLMSTCNTDSAVGLAWLGQLCFEGSATSSDNETIAGANVVIRTEGGGSEWQVFAHETGHTFGAVHDCTSATCASGDDTTQRCCPFSTSSCDADGQFIMNPSTGSGIDAFSQCTVGNVCTAILRQSVQSSCLTSNRNVQTITGQQCGNGIVEAGEDCDCGGEQGCADNPCCNPDTCKFTSESVCDPSNEECCTDTCQFASAGTVCRASMGSCDPEETCSGESATCPQDTVQDDGTDCGNGLQCASGQCTSRDLQCRSVLGDSLESNDTYACQGGCTMICHSESIQGNFECYSLMQYFLDGTPCNGGGTCQNGVCQGSNVVEELGDWLSNNKNIVIPVAAVVGGLILISILSCCISSWRRSRRARRVPKPPMLPPQNSWSSYGGAWRGPTTPQGSYPRGGTIRSGSRRPGASRSASDREAQLDQETREPMLPPTGPPPQYTPYSQGVDWIPHRQQSARYA